MTAVTDEVVSPVQYTLELMGNLKPRAAVAPISDADGPARHMCISCPVPHLVLPEL